MRATALLLDSVIVIDHLNRVSAAKDFIQARAAECAVSLVTWTEVLAGADGPEAWDECRDVLSLFPLVPLNLKAAETAARLRRAHRWKLGDAYQAATALENGLTFVTRNTRDFSPQKHAFVHVPY